MQTSALAIIHCECRSYFGSQLHRQHLGSGTLYVGALYIILCAEQVAAFQVNTSLIYLSVCLSVCLSVLASSGHLHAQCGAALEELCYVWYLKATINCGY